MRFCRMRQPVHSTVLQFERAASADRSNESLAEAKFANAVLPNAVSVNNLHRPEIQAVRRSKAVPDMMMHAAVAVVKTHETVAVRIDDLFSVILFRELRKQTVVLINVGGRIVKEA